MLHWAAYLDSGRKSSSSICGLRVSVAEQMASNAVLYADFSWFQIRIIHPTSTTNAMHRRWSMCSFLHGQHLSGWSHRKFNQKFVWNGKHRTIPQLASIGFRNSSLTPIYAKFGRNNWCIFYILFLLQRLFAYRIAHLHLRLLVNSDGWGWCI